MRFQSSGSSCLARAVVTRTQALKDGCFYEVRQFKRKITKLPNFDSPLNISSTLLVLRVCVCVYIFLCVCVAVGASSS